MDAKNDEIDRLIGRSLLTAESMFSALRDRIVEEVSANYLTATGSELEKLVWDLLVAFEPVAVQMLSDVELASFVSGSWIVDRQLPGGFISATPSISDGVDLSGRIVRFPQIEEAAQSMLDRGLLLRPDFDALDAEARRKAFTVAQVDSVETLDRVRNLVAEAVEQGTGLEEFRENLEKSLDTSRLGSAHVENVYRTNIQSAFHDGHDRLADDPTVADLFPYQEYLPITDSRAREEHLALGVATATYGQAFGIDGTGVYRKEDPFWQVFRPPWGFQCFLPGTVVQGEIKKVLRSFYSGEAVELITRSGNRLCVTVNHPILTDRGFIDAGTLGKGDYVVSYKKQVDGAGCKPSASRSSPSVDVQDKIPSIDQVFSSLSLSGQLFRFPVSPLDLHGDGNCVEGDIEVVSADSYLTAARTMEVVQHSHEFELPFADCFASRSSDSSQMFLAVNSSSTGVPCSGALSPLRSGIHSGPFQPLSLGPASDLQSSFGKLPFECTSVATSLHSELFERFSSFVLRDEIVEIRRFDFSGHVFDAETRVGWLVAQSIVASNCRCGINLLTIARAAAKGVIEAQEWQRTGVKPPLQSRLPDIPFRPDPSFA